MTSAGGLGGALLLLAAQLLSPPAPAATTAVTPAPFRFAPPVDRPMTYRVTTRRIGRDGSLVSFSLVYALQWQRLGRGYRLEAVLERIDSDAPPPVKRALTLMLQPLVGEELAYLAAPDGSRIDLVDPAGLWERVTARMQAVGTETGQPEARQMAQIFAALPAADRDRLATADIRALVAAANRAIPAAAQTAGGGVLHSFAAAERDLATVGGSAQPLEIDTRWTVDTATGLVVREQRQSWIVGAGGNGRTLVEELERTLEPHP